MINRLIAISALAFALAGCATFNTDVAKLQQAFTIATTATVPANVAEIAVSSFEVVEAASTEYFKYCKINKTFGGCNPGTKAQPGPLRQAIFYIRQGRNARDQIKAAGKNGQLISSTVYNLLTGALNSLPAIVNSVPANGGVAQ